MEVIPAIDVMEGKCVRLEQGSFLSKKSYHEDPLEVAQKFESAGFRRVHLVDLDGARQKRVVHWKILERIATRTGLAVEFGGGLASDNDVRVAFECGADRIVGGSVAVKEKERFLAWLEHYGPEKVLLGADSMDGKVRVSGWEEETGKHLIDLLHEYREAGVKIAIVTDIAKDGLLQGPSIDLYKRLRDECPELTLIASGGVSSVKDLHDLEATGVAGVVVGKAIYEGRITFAELQPFGAAR